MMNDLIFIVLHHSGVPPRLCRLRRKIKTRVFSALFHNKGVKRGVREGPLLPPMDGTCNITMRKGACKSRVSWLWFGNGNTVDSSTRKASSFLVIPCFKPTHTHTATRPLIATTIHHEKKSKRSVLYSIRPFKSMWSPVSCDLVIYIPWGTHVLIWNHPSPSPNPHFSLFPNFVFQRL